MFKIFINSTHRKKKKKKRKKSYEHKQQRFLINRNNFILFCIWNFNIYRPFNNITKRLCDNNIKSAPLIIWKLVFNRTGSFQIASTNGKIQKKKKKGGWKIRKIKRVFLILVWTPSFDPTADSDAITNRKHANLNPRVSCKSLVELQHKVSVVPHVLTQWCIRWGHHRAIP